MNKTLIGIIVGLVVIAGAYMAFTQMSKSAMSLTDKSWSWVSTTYGDGTITPNQDKFVLTFKTDNTFTSTTDCNGLSGDYTANGSQVTLNNMISTMMFCEGSQENDYYNGLAAVESYSFNGKGELVFELKDDTGTMVFK